MRASFDGSDIETLVDTSRGDPRPGADPKKWCVGVAVDIDAGKFYWTQKGGDNAGDGSILRANIEMPEGQTPADRNDIEQIYDQLPEPIDLDLDLGRRMLYWTDRGDPPRGNTVNRAPLEVADARRPPPRDRVLSSDGRNWARSRRETGAHVHYRFRGLGLQRESRWLRCEDAARRARQSDGHCIRRARIALSHASIRNP